MLAWPGPARPGVFEEERPEAGCPAGERERLMAPMLLVTCLLTGTALNGKPMLYSHTGSPIRRERARLNRLQRNKLPLFLLILKEAPASDKHVLNWGKGQKVKDEVQINNDILSQHLLPVNDNVY